MVRCMMRFEDGKVKTSSRGGTEYDNSTEHIITHPVVINFFKEHPSIILDGELYIPGKSLQYISGVARLQKEDDRTFLLQYWIYDFLDTEDLNRPFELRCEDLDYFSKNYFNPLDYDTSLNIKILEHRKVSGYLMAKKYHDIYVGEGYEGIILRDPSKEYGINKRDNRMIKMKEYQEDEFEIIGWEEGLRPTEDMVFICDCAGKEFKAKPMGDLSVKEGYVADMDNIIGKKGTIKFFNYTEDNIPAQPILKAIRDYE